ncbi:MAG: hypothetical protein EZS28_001328 [Streblomastix strix]|uniref:Uncharacterized protein n=1 Tax=Streblomastix strix TaxID=222440 RepID=A0A5J4X7B5_9EUKA|nr:MAG: hypothetical protein EZS28_001328 [Streblomastix strix]
MGQETVKKLSHHSISIHHKSSPTSDQQNSNSQSKDITDFDVDKLAMEILGNDDGIGLDHFFVKQVSNIDGEDKLSCPRHEIERQDEEIKGDINTQVESGNDLGLKFAFESHCQVQRFSQDWQQDSNLFSVIADDPLLDLAGSEEDETDIPLINEEEEEFNQGQKIDNKELNEIEANKKYDWVYDKEKERQKEKELIDVNKKKRNKQLTGLLEAEEEEDDDDDDDVEEEDKQTNDGQLKDAVESDIPINGPKIDKTIIVGSKKKKQSKVLWAWQKLDD